MQSDPVLARAFGKALAAHRKQRKMTQDALAEASGLERNAVSFWERGLRLPHLPKLFALAEALGTTPETLIADTRRFLRDGKRR